MSGRLEHSPANVVRWLLVSLNVADHPDPSGTAPLGDWPIYWKAEPDSPDNVISVYDTEPVVDGRTHVDGEMQLHDGIQVRIRCDDEIDGFNKANELYDAMARQVRRNTVSILGSTYLVQAITHKGGVLSLGTQAPVTRLHLFSFNSLVSLRQIS